MKPSAAVRRFDVFLAARGLRLDAVVCLLLQPTAGERAVAAPWVRAQDANPDWPAHVDAALADLARRLGHGV